MRRVFLPLGFLLGLGASSGCSPVGLLERCQKLEQAKLVVGCEASEPRALYAESVQARLPKVEEADASATTAKGPRETAVPALLGAVRFLDRAELDRAVQKKTGKLLVGSNPEQRVMVFAEGTTPPPHWDEIVAAFTR